MNDKNRIENELIRMKEKRNQICIELGKGYDWQLVDSLMAIEAKITQYESKLDSYNE